MNQETELWYDLEELIDMHIHTAPDVRPRYADDIQTAREAERCRDVGNSDQISSDFDF